MGRERKTKTFLWYFIPLLIVAMIFVMEHAYTQGKGGGQGGGLPENSYIVYTGKKEKLYLSNGQDVGLLFSEAGRRPVWSPDGNEVAFFYEDPADGWGIYAIRTDGSGGLRFITPITDPSYQSLDWSISTTPTGSDMILFTQKPAGESKSQIFAVNPDGTGLVQLTWNNFVNEDPSWSPNGTRFVANIYGSRWVIYDVDNVDGQLAIVGETHMSDYPGNLLENFKPLLEFDWSHDGNWIVMRGHDESLGKSGGWVVYKMNVNDPYEVVPLTFHSYGSTVFTPRFSPDDVKIYFVVLGQIYWMNSADGSGLESLLPRKVGSQTYPGIRCFF